MWVVLVELTQARQPVRCPIFLSCPEWPNVLQWINDLHLDLTLMTTSLCCFSSPTDGKTQQRHSAVRDYTSIIPYSDALKQLSTVHVHYMCSASDVRRVGVDLGADAKSEICIFKLPLWWVNVRVWVCIFSVTLISLICFELYLHHMCVCPHQHQTHTVD